MWLDISLKLKTFGVIKLTDTSDGVTICNLSQLGLILAL